jgi:hypothetical protein
MRRATIASGSFGTVLVLLALVGCRAPEQNVDPAAAISPAITPSTATAPAEAQPGFLYGRITTDSGDTYEGRLRWGGDQEAFWGDYFNGSKDENPWVAHAPLERLSKERRSVEIFGLEIAHQERSDLRRFFMARFGDIACIEARGVAGDVRVTLKSGSVFDLDRFSASDFDDGVRVWDVRRGVVDLKTWAGGIPPPARRRIRTIELLPTARLGDVPYRLHGTVRTRQGDFTGFVQWARKECVGSDELHGQNHRR